MARYGKKSHDTVKSAMHRRKKGTLKSGRGGKGGTVKSRKQAIAIGLSEARREGDKVPPRKSSSKSRGRKASGSKAGGRKSGARKSTSRKSRGRT